MCSVLVLHRGAQEEVVMPDVRSKPGILYAAELNVPLRFRKRSRSGGENSFMLGAPVIFPNIIKDHSNNLTLAKAFHLSKNEHKNTSRIAAKVAPEDLEKDIRREPWLNCAFRKESLK